MRALLLWMCLLAPVWGVDLGDLAREFTACDHVTALAEPGATQRTRTLQACARTCPEARARALLAVTLAQKGHLDQAMDTLARAGELSAPGSDDWLLHQAAQVLVGNDDWAIIALDGLLKASETEARAELLGGVLLSWAMLRRGDLATCSTTLAYLDKRQAHLEDSSDPPREAIQTYRAHRDEIRRLLALVEHGPGPVLFAEAQRKRKARDFQRAIEIYDHIVTLGSQPGATGDFQAARDAALLAGVDEAVLMSLPVNPAYVDASRLYREMARMAAGELRGVDTALQEFIRSDPHGLYRGEAMLLLAEWSIASRAGVAAAGGWLRHCQTWCDEVIEMPQPIIADNIPCLLENADEPFIRGGFGSPIPVASTGPELINRATSRWYLDRLILQVSRRLIAVCLVEGDREGALVQLDVLYNYDHVAQAMERRRLASTYSRLSDGIRTGRLFARRQELALFRGGEAMALVWAEILYEAEEWDAAFEAYTALLKANEDRFGRDQRAYLTYVIATIHRYQGRLKQAHSLLREGFVVPAAPFRDSHTQDRALYELALMETNEPTTTWFDQAVEASRDPAFIREVRLQRVLAMLLRVDSIGSEAVQQELSAIEKACQDETTQREVTALRSLLESADR